MQFFLTVKNIFLSKIIWFLREKLKKYFEKFTEYHWLREKFFIFG